MTKISETNKNYAVKQSKTVNLKKEATQHKTTHTKTALEISQHAVNILKKWDKTGTYTLVTTGSISTFDLISALVSNLEKPDLTIITFSLSEKEIPRLLGIKNKTNSLRIIVDRAFLSANGTHGRGQQWIEIIGEKNIRFTNVHAKATIISKNNDGYIITGSANLTHNPRIELFHLWRQKDNQPIFNLLSNIANEIYTKINPGDFLRPQQLHKKSANSAIKTKGNYLC